MTRKEDAMKPEPFLFASGRALANAVLLGSLLLASGCAGQGGSMSAGIGSLSIENITKIATVGQKAMESQREVTEAEEVQLGAGMTSNLLGAAPLVPDVEMQRYVNRVGRWLASQTERSNLKWYFGVIDDPDINAFTTPGGYVLITKGLFHKLRNESELAGVLAHEIAHVVQRHHLKAIRKSSGKEALSGALQLLAESRGNSDSQRIANALKGASEVYIRGLDKEDEFEADRMGVVIAARAGYTPYGLVGVLQTLAATGSNTPTLALMTKTHPLPSARLDMLEAAMGDKLDGPEKRVTDVPRFAKIRK